MRKITDDLQSPYDFIKNDEGELMLVINALAGEVEKSCAKFIYDGNSATAVLIRNNNQTIKLPSISEEYIEMMNKIKNSL